MTTEAPKFQDLGIRVVEEANPVDNVVRFEIFRDLPVVSAYSWGKALGLDGAANMSVSAKFPDAEHAEQRAIINALKKNLDKLTDSILYFIRLDNNNNPQVAGKPYCTICSKLALDTGIKEFILVHEEGIKLYNTEEYNSISYEYKE